MDLLHGYGTIVLVRWVLALFAAVMVLSASGTASAQAFKPKKGTPAKTSTTAGTTAKKAPPPASAKKARVVTSSKAPKKRTSRAAETSGRTDDLTPDADAPAKKSSNADDDYVKIEDDDE